MGRRFRLWFEPGKPAEDSAQRGTIRSVLGGRFLLHEYCGQIGGEAVEGMALWGYHLDEKRFESAWVESFGTGTAIMFSIGDSTTTAGAADPRLSMLGSYGDGEGGPRWGWRTQAEQPGPDELKITMYNITPQGEECLAVEVNYWRVSAHPETAAQARAGL